MTERRMIDVDITDRADGKVPAWDSSDSTHKYIDPVDGSGAGGIGEGRPAGVGAVTSYVLPGLMMHSMATGQLPTGSRFYQPLIVREPITLVNLVAECTAGNAATRALRGGLYEADEEWQPGDLLVEGAFDVSTTGVKTISASALALPAGRYLTCMETNHATPTMRTWGSAPLFAGSGASALVGHLTLAGTSYGTLPDPGLAWTSITPTTNATFHRIILQVTP
jgi:hypothetical protein